MPTKVERLVAVVLNFHERWHRWMSHPVLRAAVFACVIVFGLFVAVHPALAVADVKNPGILDRLMLLVAGMALGIAQILGMLVVAILDFIIPLMTYQNIVNSPVVEAGWAIVRDSVNMFFVIVLIVIAVGTIFGSQRFHWEQQVPRLLGFAILINFSKTLCGIMIDFGQIIMLTFANALKDIAAGNFVQLLGLNDFMSISEQAGPIKAALTAGETSIVPFDYLAASIAAVLMLTIVLSTLIILGAILAFRIVMLWVLVTLAPLAWFIGGAKDVVRSNAYSEWWTNFTCYVAIGPVLTFFLWLTLAVAGSGSIAASAGFTAGVSSPGASPSGLLSTIFQFEKLTSFVIGIAMLYAGFDAAQKVCSGAQGIASSAIGAARGAGRGMARRAAGLGAYAGAKGARWGVAGTRQLAGKAYGAGAARLAGSDLVNQNPFLRQFTDRGKHENLSKKIEEATDPNKKLNLMRQRDALEKTLSEQGKDLTKEFKGDTTETKTTYLNDLGKKLKAGETLNPLDKKKAAALYGELLGDAKAVEALNKGGSMNELFTALGDAASLTSKDNIKTYKKRRPDLALKEGSLDYSESLKEVDDIKEVDFTSLKDMAPEKAKALLDYLDKFETGKDKDGNTTFGSGDLAAGKFGRQRAEAYKDFMKTLRPPAADLMSSFDAAKGEFANEKVEEQFASAMRDSLDQLGGIDEASINAKDGNNAIVSSVASGLNQDRLQGMVKRFKKANDDEKRAMLPMMKKLNTIVGKADEYNPTKQTEQQKKYFEKQYKSLVEPFEASAGAAPAAGPSEAVVTPLSPDAREQLEKSLIIDTKEFAGARRDLAGLETAYTRTKDAVAEAIRGREMAPGAGVSNAELKEIQTRHERNEKALKESREALAKLESSIAEQKKRLGQT